MSARRFDHGLGNPRVGVSLADPDMAGIGMDHHDDVVLR